MSRRKSIGFNLVLGAVQSFLDHVVEPGRDECPPVGTRMVDRRGRRWEVTGDGVIGTLDHRPDIGQRLWKWDSPQAEYIGPLLNPSAVTGERELRLPTIDDVMRATKRRRANEAEK